MPSFRQSQPAEPELTKHIKPFLTEEQIAARRNPESIGDVVDRIMTGVAGGRAGPAVVLGAMWEAVVGAEFAAKTAPGACESGRLVILVPDGATASKLRFQTSEILARAAEIAGEGSVTSILFRVSPSVGKKPNR